MRRRGGEPEDVRALLGYLPGDARLSPRRPPRPPIAVAIAVSRRLQNRGLQVRVLSPLSEGTAPEAPPQRGLGRFASRGARTAARAPAEVPYAASWRAKCCGCTGAFQA